MIRKILGILLSLLMALPAGGTALEGESNTEMSLYAINVG